jgi:hypothetical protein
MKVLRSFISILQFLLMVFAVIMIMILGQLSPNIASAQLSTNGTKTWLDRDQNIKIVLSVIPVQPTIGTPSLLRFTVQNLETGKPLRNLLASVVILGVNSSQETTFRLTNISAPNGNFSTNVIFRDIGSYQVITRIMSQTHNVAALASFIVIVPLPLFTLNVPGTSSSYIIWGIAVAATAASFLFLKNSRSQKKSYYRN